MRYLFLLIGFLAVIIVADMIGGPNESWIRAIGGGIVYVVFNSMKKTG